MQYYRHHLQMVRDVEQMDRVMYRRHIVVYARMRNLTNDISLTQNTTCNHKITANKRKTIVSYYFGIV